MGVGGGGRIRVISKEVRFDKIAILTYSTYSLEHTCNHMLLALNLIYGLIERFVLRNRHNLLSLPNKRSKL